MEPLKILEKIKGIRLMRSIKGKLVFYFMLLLAVSFLFVGVMAYQGEKAALKERIRGHLTSIADIQKGRVRAWIFERISDSRFLARDDQLSQSLEKLKANNYHPAIKKTADYNKILQELNSIKQNHDYLQALVLDEKGTIVVSTDEGIIGQSRADEAYFLGAVKQKPGSAYIQDVYKDRHLGKIVMAFSGTVRDYSRPSRVGGVAVVIIGMEESFYPIFEGWPGMGRTGDTLIARREGGYIVFLNRLRGQPYAPLEHRYEMDSGSPKPSLYASGGEEGIAETTDYRGVKVLAAYRYIPETKWGFVVKEDYDDAFSSIHQLTRRVVFTMAGTFLLVFILIYFVSTRIAEPIIMMNQLAGRISEGDFSVSIPVKGKDEIGSLAVSFNHMAAALMEYRRQVDEKSAELEQANRELVASAQSLEEKVKTRTQELEDLNRALFSMMEDLDERTAALEKSQDELRSFTSELEESRNRVRENLEIVERANIELRRMDRMKDHFLGMMSHELRTPLSLITGYSSNILADRGMALNPTVVEALEGVLKGAERLKAIVSEMLDISQIDAKGLRLTFAPLNIGSLLEDVLRELNTFVKERKQEVVIGDYTGLPDVMVDRSRMRQVLLNLVGNAIKFTPDGGLIWIDFSRFEALPDGRFKDISDSLGKTSFIDITIKDSGIGLEREELDRIFEKFYEVGEIDKHATSKYAFLGRGVGLGLPIARGIVEAHGGRLWAESPGFDPEKCPGSTFHIALPVKEGKVARAIEDSASNILEKLEAGLVAVEEDVVGSETPVGSGVAKKKVLLIEDDQDIQTLTRMVLGEKYDVSLADSGREGLDKATREAFDLIMLDVYMEDMNGYEVCELLKSDERTKGVPVAMFTAGVQRWEIERGYKAGAVDYITKPFKPSELLAKVAQLTTEDMG
jgi:signal transduction histidine kinase